MIASRLFLRARLLALLFLLPCSAFGGDCSHPIILMNAFDGNFQFETNLHANDLRVEVDRKRAPIVSFTLDSRPRRIVVMVDSSGSMQTSPHRTGFGLALSAAAYTVDVVPGSASAALVTFSDKIQQESKEFVSRTALGLKVLDLKTMQPKGTTLLFDSIEQVLSDFPELGVGDAIYVVTDGGDDKSTGSLAKLKEELVSRGVRVFVFLLVRNDAETEREVRSGSQLIESLADATGGNVVRLSSAAFAEKDRAPLDELARGLAGQVENVYRIELGIPPADRATRTKVSVVNGNRGKNRVHMAYSHEMAPCPTLAASSTQSR
jgi:hypothetical protein